MSSTNERKVTPDAKLEVFQAYIEAENIDEELKRVIRHQLVYFRGLGPFIESKRRCADLLEALYMVATKHCCEEYCKLTHKDDDLVIEEDGA